MRRRRFLAGVATLVFGSSAFVVSGATDVGSLGSSGGRGWVRLDDPDLLVSPEELVESDREVRVQVLRDPTGGGTNRGRFLAERPTPVPSDHVAGDADGFLTGFDLSAMNPQAKTRIGRIDGTGVAPVQQRVAFLIANVGGVNHPDLEGQPVEITLELFDDRGQAIERDGLVFPWAIDRRRAGRDLSTTAVRLAARMTVGVGIIVDGSSSAITDVDAIGVSVHVVD